MQIQVSYLRSIRYLVGVATSLALITVLSASSAFASEAKSFTGLKHCFGPTGTTPITQACLITKSSLKILKGATMNYTDIVFSADSLTSPILLVATDEDESTATGRCTYWFDTSTTPGHGHCDFWSGTGKLAGFRASIDVGKTKSANVYSLKGTYWFDRQGDDDD